MRNFYKKGTNYYYADNNQQIWNEAELTQAAQSGSEISEIEAVQEQYFGEVAKNPMIAELLKAGNSVADVVSALQTGNLSTINNVDGQPFSAEDQQAAQEEAMEDNRLYYEQLKEKETADAEASLAKQQADYQDYLISSGAQFETDKATADQKAADSGVLFSGARVQKEKNLKNAYDQNQNYVKNNVANNIGSLANEYQYKYGADAAKGLSSYYNLGGNTYNSSTARGGVGSSGLSNMYSPENYSYGGTREAERTSNAQQRAADYLKNKGNKLLGTSYTNQF